MKITIEDERIETKVLEGEAAFVLVQTACGNGKMDNELFFGGNITLNWLYREVAEQAAVKLVETMNEYNEENPDSPIPVARRMDILGSLVGGVEDVERKAIEGWAEKSSDEEIMEAMDATKDLLAKILKNCGKRQGESNDSNEM